MTTALIVKNKEAGQDFEWYPTTYKMLSYIDDNILASFHTYNHKHEAHSVLDIGAGDGRAAQKLAHGGDMYAVEKSIVLLDAMPRDIFIVGTDFHQTTFIDKKVDIIFCNPPYSEFEAWASRIISEANCKMLYFILPDRWSNSWTIKNALKEREATAKIIGHDSFIHSDRPARSIVDIIAIKLQGENERRSKTDPFEIWFDKRFSFSADQEKPSDYAKEKSQESSLKNKIKGAIVAGNSLIPALVELYNNELLHLQSNYTAVTKLDADILEELNISVSGLREALKQRIKNLKSKYWHEFFSNYGSINSRLTNASREKMLNKLNQHLSVDFTEGNCLAISIWAIKNANRYYDDQLVSFVESMVTEANIKLYKSNKRTFNNDEWRYSARPKGLSKYALELRIILHRFGGIQGKDEWSCYYEHGLHRDDHKFIQDLLTIANNLGFPCLDNPMWHEWSSGKKILFTGSSGKVAEIKAFKNGNIHIKFNQKLIKKLNIEFGRLNGWLKDPIQASEELNIGVKEAQEFFNTNKQLTAKDDLPMITGGE